MNLRRAIGVGTTAAFAALVVATPALAADGRIVHLASDQGKLQVIFSATGLAAGSSIDPASVHVAFNGTAVSARAEPAGATVTATVRRAAMLVIDTSGSMAGPGIADARSAATAFLQTVPSDVYVGLLTFSDHPVLRAAPTLDHAVLRREVERLKASGETALYDAALAGAQQLKPFATRTLVLLTDGADTRSRASLASAAKGLASAKIVVDAVGFRTTDTERAPLAHLAAASGGQLLGATAANDLASAFRQAAHDISTQLLVTVTVPTALAGRSGTIAVSAAAGGATIADSAFVTLPSSSKPSSVVDSGPQPVTIKVSGVSSHGYLLAGLALLFLALAGIVFFAMSSLRVGDGGNRVRRRLSIYTLTGRVQEQSEEKTVFGESGVARSAVDLAGRVIAKRDFESALLRQLEASAIPLKPAEWLLIQTGVMLGVSLLLFLLSGGKLVPTLIGIVLGIALPLGFLKFKESRRTSAFLAGLPDTLQLIAGSLSAGYSLPQAVDTVVTEGTEPIAGEFKRALIETRLGVPIEDALEGIAERVRSQDFAWVVMAIRIQREVGGNLAEILTTVAATLRERERLRRQIQVLSAEGRLSAWILGGLPVVFSLYLLTARPAYLKILVTDRIGIVMLVGGVILMIVGTFWLRKVVRVEV